MNSSETAASPQRGREMCLYRYCLCLDLLQVHSALSRLTYRQLTSPPGTPRSSSPPYRPQSLSYRQPLPPAGQTLTSRPRTWKRWWLPLSSSDSDVPLSPPPLQSSSIIKALLIEKVRNIALVSLRVTFALCSVFS